MDKLRKMLLGNRYLVLFALLAVPSVVWASFGAESNFAPNLLWIVVILILARLAGLVEKVGQPAVLGELLVGVLLGNLALLGINWFTPLAHNEIINFLSELGVVILLFQIGLESNLTEMSKVGWKAFWVAVVGVVTPFVLGTFVAGPLLLPGQSFNTYLFLGAILTATSVGITARVFKDLKKLKTPEAQIVLGAAVIDDVIGLIILAVVSAVVVAGSVGLGVISIIAGKAIGFLVAAIVVGQLTAPYLGKFFSKINTGVGMKFTLAICFGLFLAYLASLIGLAPIVGAFAAGLVLDPVHFKYFKDPKVVRDVEVITADLPEAQRQTLKESLSGHTHKHVEDLIEPLGLFLIPIFFVMTGFGVKLETLNNWPIILLALGLTVIAFIGKIASGLVAGKVNKWIVGFGMIPRGEVGLIFVMIGKNLGVVNDEIYSAVVIMIIITTLATPPILSYLIKRQDAKV